ncbi:tetratricopeptide repeat protein [Gaoshiqia sediminis]|uniref:Tetratricopeptide repeat protein n=1 Tax=Gaoshiqia sediminis TaxID=2986998 RepID=A0AA41Y6Z7_9BACT|nr:tetratricopeptide repeat protein [Gaoshiqia sediminis]MCW0484581.1 tetratricopeptide repeat protein [Gaoshiqia sediminis]
MKARWLQQTAWLLFLIGQPGFIQAQEPVSFRPDSVCKVALQLPWNEGISMLTGNVDNCGEDSTCMLKIYFTAGYICQQAATAENAPALLERSFAFYMQAHQANPSDMAVVNNLFLVSKALGNTDVALELLDQAIELDNRNKFRYYVNKGDLLFDNGDFSKALSFYQPAFFANTNNEALGWKIFQCYSQLTEPQKRIEGLVTFAEKLFELGANRLAADGFMLALHHALQVNDQSGAVQACVRWAEIISTYDGLTESYARELPDTASWPHRCNSELQKILHHSFKHTDELKWWMASDYRQHITASIMLKMESSMLMDGKPDKAVQLLETALEIAPEFYRYNDPLLRKYFPAKMGIAIELSRLYNRYPEMDLDGAKYDAMIMELFNKKSEHYLQNDIESIQRSHTMLGLIYADRDVWTSSWYAGNGIFQLTRAIDFQKKLEDKDPEKFKPVPSLYQLLAKGYRKTNQPEQEFRALVNAAIGYLDLDNLTVADSILRSAANSPYRDSQSSQLLKELGWITGLRLGLRNGTIDVANSPVDELEKTIVEHPLFKGTAFQNDPSFLNRQRFKFLADLGEFCTEENASYKLPVFEIKALDYINREKALGNYQDINRLSRIEGKFAASLGPEDVIRLRPLRGTVSATDETTSWSLTSGGYQTRIVASPDLFIAGKVYENMARENESITIETLEQIQIRQGNVYIPYGAKETEKINGNTLRQIKGVTDVRIVPKTR